MSGALLAQFSSLNLGKLLPLGRKALERSLSEAADSIGAEPPLHHMLCLAAIKNPRIRPTVEACAPYLNLFHAGFILAVDVRDLAEVLELAGMPAISTESVSRDIYMVFMAGTLSQWRDALFRGCQQEVTPEVRHLYNSVFHEFKRAGIAGAFEFKQREQKDNTFLLEHKA